MNPEAPVAQTRQPAAMEEEEDELVVAAGVELIGQQTAAVSFEDFADEDRNPMPGEQTGSATNSLSGSPPGEPLKDLSETAGTRADLESDADPSETAVPTDSNRPRSNRSGRRQDRGTANTANIRGPVTGGESVGQEACPDAVKHFCLHLKRHISEGNVYEIYPMYESGFNRVTEKYFSKSPWPSVEVVESHVGKDQWFSILYQELYYRHIYSKFQPNLEQRLKSFENYCALFDLILGGASSLDLPNQWLWDIMDEFIYQFESFQRFRTKFRGNEAMQTQLLHHTESWSISAVLRYLNHLVYVGRINEQLIAQRSGADPQSVAGELGSKPLYKMLGYFSLISLLRLHCLCGDFYNALKVIDHVDLNPKKALHTRITACYVTTYYYIGFAYMMMERYSDAIRLFAHMLVYITRTRQYHMRSYQYDQIMKKSEQMYALLAICTSLCPQRVDEHIHGNLREKFGDQLNRMQRGGDADGLASFEELFTFACPKFVNLSVNQAKSTQERLTSLFVQQIRDHIQTPILRSYLKLYSTLPAGKLEKFLDLKDARAVKHALMCFKHKSLQKRWTEGPLLSGEFGSSGDLDFYLNEDMIHVAERKIGRKFGEYFLRNVNKLEDTIQNLTVSKS